MAAEQQSNVININGTEYDRNELSQKANYLIAQMQDLSDKQSSLQFQLDQVSVARNFFAQELEKELNGEQVQTLAEAQAAVN